jgi:hypothetical protein
MMMMMVMMIRIPPDDHGKESKSHHIIGCEHVCK